MVHQQYCDKEVHLTCNCGKLPWMRKREKTVEKKLVELLKHYFYPWIDVDLVVSCYQYDFKEVVRARESSEFSLKNVLTSTRPVQEKQINMQLSSIGVGGTSTFFEKCSLTNPTLYYFPYNGFVFLVSYFVVLYLTKAE